MSLGATGCGGGVVLEWSAVGDPAFYKYVTLRSASAAIPAAYPAQGGATELGWTRTFDTPDGPRTLPAHWHTLKDLRQAATSAGLFVEAVVEPVLDPTRGVPARARWVPVALVLRLRRPA